ncbi:MAG: tetratricopeptide repeat protein [Spirochaetaceae bacterium]
MIRYALPLPSRRELKQQYNGYLPELEALLEDLRAVVEQGLGREQLRGTVKCRVKSFDSLYEKLLRKLRARGSGTGREPADGGPRGEEAGEERCIEIADLLGLRIVSPFLSDAARVERFVEDTFNVLEKERKGVQENGGSFGYASTHYLCAVPQEVLDEVWATRDLAQPPESDRFEVQVRTILQEAWAEVEHELIYKSEETPLNEPARRKLAALNASLTLADIVFEEIRDSQRRLRTQLSQRRQDFMDRVAGSAAEAPPDLLPPDRIVQGGDEIDTLLLKALHYHNAKDFTNAAETYTEILEREERAYVRAVVYIHRGMADFAQGHYEEAVADFTEALHLDDDNWKALYYRGVIYRATGRYQEALADLNRCVTLDTYRYESLLARAELLLEMGDRRGALADARQALRLEPESEEAERLVDALENPGDGRGEPRPRQD